MKKLYETTVDVSGGRDGQARSTDGQLNVTLSLPKALGGSGAAGATNPEQLFAAGYGACFESALRHVARLKKVPVQQSSVTATVRLLGKPDGGFQLAVKLAVQLPDLDPAQAQELVTAAHAVCPYSNATRGNIDVEIGLA